MEIFPSLISSDLLNLQKTIETLNDHCNGYHIDIMDNHFVPNLTWGHTFSNAIANITILPLHVHLMVDNPVDWIDRLRLRNQDIFIFHIEAIKVVRAVENIIFNIRNKGWKIGIAIKPQTDVSTVYKFLKDLDHVLIMSVEPGFSGQKFMPKVAEKVERLIERRDELALNFKIGMDGGIGKDNIKMLTELGVDQLGVASAIFSQPDYLKALQELYNF